MRDAREGGYAVGYFESWDIPSLQGVLDAAEETASPVIVGFNGEFLSEPHRARPERLSIYAGVLRAAADVARVPTVTIFNECSRQEWLLEAVELGFDIVMPSLGRLDLDAYRRLTRSVTAQAAHTDVAVEVELGELPSGASGEIDSSHAEVTDPRVAEEFMSDTGADLLAVSVGNVHVLPGGRRTLDLERLEEIHRYVSHPLVLHGGTGIEPESLRTAIELGVCKVNYGTRLKLAWLEAAQNAFASVPSNPHEFLGMGGSPDLFEAVRNAVREEVLGLLPDLGCKGRAAP